MDAYAPGSWLRARRDLLLQTAVHVGALIPLALLIWDGLHGNLTFNPIQAITQRTGKTALVLLMLSLACTPAALFGFRRALKWRRPLGLYAFLYVSLHFMIFTTLDYRLDPTLLRGAIFEKRYVLAGLAAGLLLVPLAVTSTQGWRRRLGRNWPRLHHLVYVAAALVIVHYLWLVKSDTRVPMLYGVVLASLLIIRTPPAKRAIIGLRQRIRGRKGTTTGPSVRARSDVRDEAIPFPPSGVEIASPKPLAMTVAAECGAETATPGRGARK